ncbi:hypothetical protein PLESTM_000546600 [Pleodorina starrii]|nr:hypothetical protein PLESTM_000546600 [Pleodorina starrii]
MWGVAGKGGELFDHISKKQGFFTERQAAGLLRSLMLFLAHMHSKGIAHLDIKPENLMFDSEGASGVLKVLDFGSSVFVQPNETVRNAFGTVRYASPEMANDVCGQKADIWSAGVVMYILLCGRAPFLKANDIDTLNYIKNGPRVKFNGERWTTISQSAKDCIKALLEPNPRLRPSAAEVLTMPWLKQQVPETVIVPDTLKHLRTFANQSRIRRLLLGLMADQLAGSGANQLLGQFYTLDKDFSGTLEVSELVKAAKEAIPELSEVEINRMFEALDVDRTGTVDVKEFFAGLIQTIDEEKQNLVAQKSFTMLDKRGSGYVTKEAFMEVLLERAQMGTLRTLATRSGAGPGAGAVAGCSDDQKRDLESRMHCRQSGPDGADAQVILDPGLVQELEAEFAQLDANGDGVLSFEEFKAILGITSTPEGLTLAQPQLAAVPSLQEGMETLAQTLRTRTCSKPKDEQHRQGSLPVTQRLTLTRVSLNGGGGAAAAGGGPGGAGGGRDVSGANQSQPLSVDRAQLDLELPYDLETRDLLQLLAPAKRTASQAPLPHWQQSVGGGGGGFAERSSSAGVGLSGRSNGGRGAAAAAPVGGGGGAVAPLADGGPPSGLPTAVGVVKSANSLRLSRSPSSNMSVTTFTLLDKVPSMRAPSLPPLPSRGNFELDAASSTRNSTNGGSVSTAREGKESPPPPPRPGAGAAGTSAADADGAAVRAARERDGSAAGDHVRWRDPPSWNSARSRAEADGGLVSTAGGVAEAAGGPGLESSPRSSALIQRPPPPPPQLLQSSSGDDTPLLGGFARSSGTGAAGAGAGIGGWRPPASD